MNIIKRLLAKHRENASRVSDDDPIPPGMIGKAAYDRMTDGLNTAVSTGKLEPFLESALKKEKGEEIPVTSKPELLDSSLDVLLNRVSKNTKNSPSDKAVSKAEPLAPTTDKKPEVKTTSKKTTKKTGSKTRTKTASDTPKIKGISWRKDRKEFEVRVTSNGKRKTIGYRKTQREAVELKEHWKASQNK